MEVGCACSVGPYVTDRCSMRPPLRRVTVQTIGGAEGTTRMPASAQEQSYILPAWRFMLHHRELWQPLNAAKTTNTKARCTPIQHAATAVPSRRENPGLPSKGGNNISLRWNREIGRARRKSTVPIPPRRDSSPRNAAKVAQWHQPSIPSTARPQVQRKVKSTDVGSTEPNVSIAHDQAPQ
ncbi:hypothetical protein L227DRAFT_602161 [Lentinus tigrinus ALCF2SS1-6]|uniref:Uncharacterized protein n=1 Tax=Lentinus tigrinus ALCF2SS1-6 TaxID=1328759 RepID=A0A5C2S9T3_9APHY|nr:hypothetical protein L227DRAFT_602161 [Lentinus tigrinus ALCF2SS1-6]